MFPPQAWTEYHRHREEIGQLLDPRCYSLPWLDNQLVQGKFMAFGSDSAVIVVEVRRYPEGATELHGIVAAGALEGILSLIDEALSWGKSLGLTFASIASRPGWGKVLQDRGFKLHQTDVRKEL